jgi:hypothetical protein
MSDRSPELVKRGEEWCRRLGAHEWERLAALYHPDYRGRRGVARYLTAAEEVSRLREEVSSDPGARTNCCLTPLSTAANDDDAQWTVEERLERIWSDGCRRVMVRRFEQRWRREGRNWLLYSTERVPRCERSHCETALLFREEIDWAERLERSESGQPGGSRFERWLLRSYIHAFDSLVRSPQLSVKIDPGSAPAEAAAALRRASEAAIEAWNRSLEGVLELRLLTDSDRPDILIRGCDRPIYGCALGLAVFAYRHRASVMQARLAEAWIALVEHPGTPALTLDPIDLYETICHELGHCFGLDHCGGKYDCARRSGVMGSRDWQTRPPAAPFLAERQAVLRWLLALHGWRAGDHRRLGQVEQAEQAEKRAALLLAEMERDLAPGTFPPVGLDLEGIVVPAPVRHYWAGNAACRRRDWMQAQACYDQALEAGTPYPELLVRRGWLRGGEPEGLADLRRAVAIVPSWALAWEVLLALLEGAGRGREAAVERAVLRRLAARTQIERNWLTARTVKPRWVGGIAAVLAAGWVARYAAASLYAQVVRVHRRTGRASASP